ncbi:TIGR03756 family integrating conjugative element protein [Aquisalimonas asiatica]|uniref:Integrating conjugative element protein, PFL_4710 family n=1 Tax=Aquisalimonas asiatica TaxID=406100 RepID=A0A1H8T224_9GAMM|nr:TIGR03756 family integrating conjugative element protein [Aquisalimonas asiatica]SEO85099.1 integrating conjugative element protein, PFL_4710 family [Aquisalimonas asiatica]
MTVYRHHSHVLVAGAVLLAALAGDNTTEAQQTGADTPAHGSINTAEIISQTVSAIPNCLSWRIEGICVWLNCGITGCSIRESLRVGHYNPDLVVCAYNHLAHNPWDEIRNTLGLTQEEAAATALGVAPIPGAGTALPDTGVGDGHHHRGETGRDHDRNIRYKEADVIGHPLASLMDFVGEAVEFLCPSETEMLYPYYQSALDAVQWRYNLIEMAYPEAFTPGLREIGNWPVNTWGAVYPRGGFTTQSEDPKAGAIVAQRAGDIVTRTGQPRVYTPVEGSVSGYRVWTDPLREGDADTGQWQMHYPRSSGSCEVFGEDDRYAALAGWADDMRAASDVDQDYAWTLWRRYSCCQRRGSYITTIPLPSD